MSVETFVRRNRAEIDTVIKAECPNCGRLNDEERRLWVLNHEGLYNLALSAGCKI